MHVEVVFVRQGVCFVGKSRSSATMSAKWLTLARLGYIHLNINKEADY